MTFKDLVRRCIWRIAPAYMADRGVRRQRLYLKQQGLSGLAARFAGEYGGKIRYGPFAGMAYPADGDVAVLKYLGRYETEIQDWIEDAIQSQPATVIDIGAAEGYYAVGFKYACPLSAVVAFELSPMAREACAETARANGLTIDLRGRATAKQLLRLPVNGAVVLCDCEGAEVDLLTPAVVRHFRAATVIVELHDGKRMNATQLISERFTPTHSIEMREVNEPRDIPTELRHWSDAERALALKGSRGTLTRWARFTPRVGLGSVI